ncbi:hypothetical protein AAEO57_17910 [Flavobacterium sp. DGU38]|uniref:Uncharacterized protein n=1 Tax=Flavobacterium calami TaxID=3139144 RepID=A0ABU9ITA1_9FLAO
MIKLFLLGEILNALKFSTAVLFMFICAAGLTFTKKIYSNSTSKNIRFNFTLFQMRLCKDIIFKNILYVSVYKNHSDRDFEVQLWFTETKKKSVSIHFRYQSAFSIASKIARGLQIDLLDATEKGNFKWIKKEDLQIARDV